MFKKVLARLFQAGFLLLLLVAGLWAASRVLYPTEAQREAIAEIERWPDYPGENAFPLVWTLGRDVPQDQLERVMAEDVARIELPGPRALRESGSFVLSAEDLPSAANDFPDLAPGEEDRKRFCGSLEVDCLGRVRQDPDGFTDLVERHSRLIDRVGRLGAYAYIRSEFPANLYAPTPSYGLAYLAQTRNAVWFANGRTREALAATCRHLLTWRRLGPRSDGLVPRMVGIAIAGRGGGRLLADMLAELPVDDPLPAVCEEALAPPADIELSMCNAMRGEFAIHAGLALNDPYADDRGTLDRLAAMVLIDHEASLGRKAEDFLALCAVVRSDEEFHERLESLNQGHDSIWRLECFGSLMNCVLDSLAIPAYGDYILRVIDDGARYRLLGTLAWMRNAAGEGMTPAELLDARPADLNDPADELGFGPDGKTLQIRLRWTRRGETWSIPLPPALYAESKAEP